MFKFWSEIKKEARDEMRPDFGFRSWDDLASDDKIKIWLYLWKNWFFDPNRNDFEAFISYKHFASDKDTEKSKKLERITVALDFLNNEYKAKAYARNFLDNRSIGTALNDFYSIYLKGNENVVFELLSIYAKKIITERENGLQQKKEETVSEFTKRNEEYKWMEFDEFVEDLNEVFDHFGVYVFLSRQGFIPRQDEKIIKDIYQPVLKILTADEYKDVNQMLKNAFKNFRDGDFDKVIQNSINSMHAYLQLKLSKKIGNGNFKTLLKEAQKEEIIPQSALSIDLYDKIESFLARERRDKTAAHPSSGKPTNADALFVLNLTMVVLQSFLNFKK